MPRKKPTIDRFIEAFVSENDVVSDFVNSWKRIYNQALDIEADKELTDQEKEVAEQDTIRGRLVYEREIKNRMPEAFWNYLIKKIFDKAGAEVKKERRK